MFRAKAILSTGIASGYQSKMMKVLISQGFYFFIKVYGCLVGAKWRQKIYAFLTVNFGQITL
ncbi:hypothetical protein [Desnuesiella massiliensis]|uniref:hypothetical protein n=1 Tax=Desnuesiella massiliensis TaxID=1650662 RepID=UPI0006E3FFD9|nr:hypothetical protein [Desnuesiella massiliensis]